MNVEEYRHYCLSIGPDVEEKLPFKAFRGGESVLVFYVNGHMFSFFDIDNFGIVSLKCQPERIGELRATHLCIGKPFNLPEKHWIGIDARLASDELLKELTCNSYNIVKAKHSKKAKRPIARE